MCKVIDDIKKVLGESFLKVISLIVNVFGGFSNVLKIVLGVFVVYCIVMILGNVVIGIFKVIV